MIKSYTNFILFSALFLLYSDCTNGNIVDSNLVFFYKDFGPHGIKGPVNITISNPLKVGSVINVVTKAETRGSVNIISDDIYVIHVDARIQKNELIINTSKRLNLEWRTDGLQRPNPVVKNAKTLTTLIYESNGWRIFINNREVEFYDHRTDKVPQVIALYYDYIYEVMYTTSVETTANTIPNAQ